MRTRCRTIKDIETPEAIIPSDTTADRVQDDGGPMLTVDFWDYGIMDLRVPRQTLAMMSPGIVGVLRCR